MMISEQLERVIDNGQSFLIVAPHQDDEILGCAWLMQTLSRRAKTLAIVWLTDGGAAHGRLDDLARSRLVKQRQREALSGVRSLMVNCEPYFLGIADGSLQDPENQVKAVRQIRTIVAQQSIDTLFVTDGNDSHADHRAAFAIAQQIIGPAIFAYPVSARYDGVEETECWDTLKIAGGDCSDKEHALACHVSQSVAAGAVYPLSAETIKRFCSSSELFYPVDRVS